MNRYQYLKILCLIQISCILTACNAQGIQEKSEANMLPCGNHSTEYIEPVQRAGKYYLDGDVTQCYFDVTDDNKIKLVGNEEQFINLYLHDETMLRIYNDNNNEPNESIKNAVAYDMSNWEDYRDYVIYTSHNYDDSTILFWTPVYHEDGSITGSGTYYTDDNTITYMGEFRLIE